MSFAVRSAGDVTVLVLDGDLDAARAPGLLGPSRAAIEEATAVVLDLTAVTFLDSAGARMIDGLAAGAAARGVPFCVAAAPGGAARFTLELLAVPDTLLAATAAEACARVLAAAG